VRERLGSLGITDRSHIVVVAGKGGIPWAARAILTLDYAGLGARTSLLDGGQPAWVKEGRPVTTTVPPKKASQLAALRVNPIIVNADFVKSHVGKPGVSVVDGRAAAFYTGVAVGSDRDAKQRAGHIAGAKSIPFSENYTEDERVKPNAELQALFARAGVAPADTVVGYCHIGQQATAMLFAARLLGHPVRLYDGSFEDWSRRPAAEYRVEATR
jgi:thiosulfate/3-mercaptopyruvate sulfurtransferase